MSTRCLTILKNEDNRDIAVVYRHSDGYPEGHGEELVEFLRGRPIVNGIGVKDAEKQSFNGMDDLAATVVAYLKTKHPGVGAIYLHPAGTRGMGAAYTYTVTGQAGDEQATVAVTQTIGDITPQILLGGAAKELYRETKDAFGCIYKIVENHHYRSGPFYVEVCPQHADGSHHEEEFTEIGGGPGMPSGSFRTEKGAHGFLKALDTLDPEDEQAFWDLLESWEGR